MAESTRARRGWPFRIRPSNLVLLAAAPFIIYLFATGENYQRSLRFIIGVEQNGLPVFLTFVQMAVVLLLGAGVAWLHLRGRLLGTRYQHLALAGCAVHILWLILLAFGSDLTAFWNSVVANMVDSRASPLVVPGSRPVVLTEAAQAALTRGLQIAAGVYVLVALAALALQVFGEPRGRVARAAAWAVLLVNALLLAYLLLFAHLGFATGLFVTVRATFMAYFVAAILGLVLAGLLGLHLGDRTVRNYGVVVAILAIAAVALFTRPTETYVLVGELDARVAIVKGTPKRLSDRIRFGEFPAAIEERTAIRSVATVEGALDLVETNDNISAAFIPGEAVPAGIPTLWEVSFLPDRFRTPAIIATVLGGLLLVLTFGAWQSGLHPLAVFAEFFIDVIRGIPMLVIILYIGLPLSGAVKDATNEVINLPNMMRGIIAISVGYSAFMAEIFRAGIEAIPRGQIEAARSVGLSRWNTARFIVLPQALKIVIPPLGNEFIAMFKDTSLLSILSVRDVTQRMREFQSASFLPFAPFNTAAIVYVVLTLAASSMLKWIERRTDAKSD